MLFRSARALAWFATVALALQLPALARAQEAINGSPDAGYIEIADAGESDNSSDQGTGSTASNADANDGDAGSDDSADDQPFAPEGSGRNDADVELGGPNGALKAVQGDQALPLDGIVAIARHLTNGQIIDARLRPVKGVLQYELKVLESNNEVRRYSFNARTGKFIRVR